MKKILGLNNGNYMDMLLLKKNIFIKINRLSTMDTYSMVNHVTYCILCTLIKTYHW